MSEADSLWYLRHRDGVEHGPFQLAELVTAAQAGNVAADTCVRHEVHTRAQWVFATRVQPIADVMTREAESPTLPGPPRQPQQTNPVVPRQTPSPPQSKSPTKPSSQVSRSGPESVFRGSTLREPQPKRESVAEPAASISPLESAAVIRSHRAAAFPVPRTFVDAVQTLFLDFRFQRFITPWIVKILWAVSLLLAILSITKLGYDFFIQPTMSTPSPGAGVGNWQFGPINEQPLLLMRILIFGISASITCIIVLCIRVICEMIIVIFLAGGDVSELRKLLKQPKT